MPDQLSRTHRRAQTALRAIAIRDLLKLWPAFDVNKLAATWPPLERALVLLIQVRGRTSGGLAATYYRAHRREAGVPGAPPRPKATPTTEEIQRGLRVVGPIEAARALSLGRQAEQVAQATLSKMGGAVGMYVLDHGRDTLVNMVRADKQALGWARGTSGTPCAFCAMLASRGPVYRTEETANFEAHRACACMPVPQWSTDQEWPDGSRDHLALWNASTRGQTPGGALQTFRRALEGR